MNSINLTQSNDRHQINAASARCGHGSKFATALLVLLAGLLCGIQLPAQTVAFKGEKIRVTVPVGYTGLTILSNNMAYTTNGIVPDVDNNLIIQPINVDITSLPAGVSYVFTNASVLTNLVPFTTTFIRTNANNTERIWVVLSFDGSTPEGTYTFSVNATGGATNNLLYTLDVCHLWNGSTNAVLDGAGSWSDTSKWLGGGLPGSASVVVFNDGGGQTNQLVWDGAAPPTGFTNPLVNVVISSDTTIGSLRFSQTNNGNIWQNLEIEPGRTLSITGPGGFSILPDFVREFTSPNISGANVSIVGTNASLVISNTDAIFSMLVDGQTTFYLDMTRLANFKATVNRFAVGDGTVYPNILNLDANTYGNGGNTSVPRRFLPRLYMASNNVILATFVGPENYTNSQNRLYSISDLHTLYGSGSTTANQWYLGASNLFLADSICFVGANQGGNGIGVRFHPNFTNNPIAVFRNTNGTSRMTVFAVGDAGGITNGEYSNIKGYLDFGVNRGVIDALVDRLYLGMDRDLIVSNANAQPNYQGKLGMGAGTFDCNTAIFGFQNSGVHEEVPLSQDYRGYCQGDLFVSNTAVFKCNGTITLGYTTETNAGATGGEAQNNRGSITIGPGGTVMANTIDLGGVTRYSANNFISLSGGATLIVSNTIADPDKRLTQLSMSGGSTLELFVNGNSNAPYVYTTNLTVSAGNFIKIGGLQNVSYVGGVAQFPLITYSSGTPTVPGAIMPDGFLGSGSIVPNGGAQWDLYVSTNPPNTNLVWRGPAGGSGTADWDASTKNWLDPVTGLMTNFHNGDWVKFDDTPGYATNINQAVSILLPGQINVSNVALQYKFTGSGLQGGAVLTKQGAGTLEIAGTVALPFTVNGGVLTNTSSGSIGGVTVAAGASLGNNGTINGSVNCAGQGFNLGTINGALTVASGGVVTNMSYIQGGSFTLQTNAFLYNGVGATLDHFGDSTVATNATLFNDGYLGDSGNGYVQTITVNGKLEDTGASGTPTMSLQTLTIGAGGLFIPGGDGIGSTVVRNPLGTTLGASPWPGRVTLGSGSTNIIKVDPGAPSFTLLKSGALDFGPSQSSQLQNGCTLIITNTTGTPFSAGQYFKIFVRWDSGGNPVPTGTSTNCYPIIIPTTPGPGLAWDLSRLWATPDFGNIGVVVPPVVHMTNSWSFPDGTNVVGQFSWASTNIGWRLQTLVTPNNIGLVASSNYPWTGVAGSWTNLSMTVSNRILGGTNTFFRLVFP